MVSPACHRQFKMIIRPGSGKAVLVLQASSKDADVSQCSPDSHVADRGELSYSVGAKITPCGQALLYPFKTPSVK